MEDATIPPLPPKEIQDLLYGFCKSNVLFSAIELGLIDTLHSAKTPQSPEWISTALGTNLLATECLLNTLVSLEILIKSTTDDSSPVYANTLITERFLVASSPTSIVPKLKYYNEVFYTLYYRLPQAIKTGENQWDQNNSCFFENLCKADRMETFLGNMHVSSRPDASTFVQAFDLKDFKNVCDLGGAPGTIAYEACNHYPNMTVSVLDLPGVIESSKQFTPSIIECPNQANVTFVPGDFFTGDLPNADLYILCRIVHDWSEEKIDLLLKKIFLKLSPGGAVLLGEKCLYDDKTGPLFCLLSSLLMLLACDTGARERTGEEYKNLLEKHGFVDVQIRSKEGGIGLEAIFARKP